MIVTSGSRSRPSLKTSSSLKKLDSASINNILLRSDGFKNVFRGLTYKSSQPLHTPTSGNYTSLGKRTPAREYHCSKDTECRLQAEEDKTRLMRRTKTAEVRLRGAKTSEGRDQEFEKADLQENECFSRLLIKLSV